MIKNIPKFSNQCFRFSAKRCIVSRCSSSMAFQSTQRTSTLFENLSLKFNPSLKHTFALTNQHTTVTSIFNINNNITTKFQNSWRDRQSNEQRNALNRQGRFDEVTEPIRRIKNQYDPHTPWLVYGIIAANLVVFLWWQNPTNRTWMFDNFTCSFASLAKERYWTLLTSSYSQKDFTHLAFNMLTLFFFAPKVCKFLFFL